ncbi:MAG: T9SS type A sorting domain-containing protein [Candidatus Delongbacteria bacterium]|nr:T9SS type A sorting domain-containing protein [Candidatus Delongbacteria bacterium]
MKVEKIIILLLLFVTHSLISQEQDEKRIIEWFVHVYIASWDDIPIANLEFNTNLTDTSRVIDNWNEITEEFVREKQWYPVMFNIPDKYDETKLIGIHEYLTLYGEEVNGVKKIDYEPLLAKALNEYFLSMTNKYDVKLTFETDPTNQGSKYWDITGPPYDPEEYTHENELTDLIIEKYCDEYGTEEGMALWESHHDYRHVTMLVFPRALNGYYDGGVSHGSTVYAYYNRDALNITTHTIAHELGHSIFQFGDKGYDRNVFWGYIDGASMGKTFSTTGAYDLMYHNDCFSSPFALYGLIPMTTQDLINYQYTVFDNVINFEGNELCNKIQVTLKAEKKPISDEEIANNVANALILPVRGIDFSETSDNSVEDQHFLIEYKNGKRFDNFSPLYHENESRGVMISHVINATGDDEVIDIECAVPFEEGQRVGIGSDLYFCGKPVNDWMDDLWPNSVYDECLGGKGAWWKAPTALNMCGLPTDFFNDTDRNMFTPTTYPSTNSWEDRETHIAVLVNELDDEYADVTVYRNYFSVPLCDTNSKELDYGIWGLEITNDGYIGENFYVGEGKYLYLGGGEIEAPKTTLVPGTDMFVSNTGVLQLKNYSVLGLENSKLEFKTGSIFLPMSESKIVIDNSELFFQDGSEIDQTYINNYDISIEGESSFYKSNFDLIEGSLLTLNFRSTFNLISGTTLTVANDSKLMFKYGSELVIEDGATLVLEEGVDIELVYGSKIIVKNGGSLKLLENSELVITNEIDLIIEPDAIIEAETGAKITVEGLATLDLTNVTITGNTTWQGIVAEIGSKVTLLNTRISNAVCGLYAEGSEIYGIYTDIDIKNSSFTDCENGVSLVNCEKYSIDYNHFYGKGGSTGSGITLTHCGLPITGNFVSNYGIGVKLVSSSLTLAKNTIKNNINNGMFITGNGSKPTLVDVVTKDLTQKSINNDIIDNGLTGTFYARSQIYMRYCAGVYMTNGYNNVYSGQNGTIPSVPCIKGIYQPIINEPEPYIDKVVISAEMNYWGYPTILDENWGYFFSLYYNYDLLAYISGYTINYEPYGLKPFTEGDPYPAGSISSNEPPSRESTLLYNAMRLEQDDKYSASINLYEKIIEEYTDSEEYYVATARLPYVYDEAEEPLARLLDTYDEALASEEITNKKFFKEMKVSTKIKDKKYDEAIILAEEMKSEATTDEEKALSDIDIAIANMMKDAESKGKGSYTSSSVSDLLAKLTGDETESEKTDIAGTALPTEFALYQNYPNPFNPVTQIKFALPTAGSIKLNVYNINGQLVSELVNGSKEAGIYTINFNANNYNSGIYFYTLEANGMSITKKMILTK